jgi:hypothetical protein
MTLPDWREWFMTYSFEDGRSKARPRGWKSVDLDHAGNFNGMRVDGVVA